MFFLTITTRQPQRTIEVSDRTFSESIRNLTRFPKMSVTSPNGKCEFEEYEDNCNLLTEEAQGVQSICSILTNDVVMKTFQEYGSLSDLYKLRQVNQELYRMLTTPYLDSVATTIRIIASYKQEIWQDSDKPQTLLLDREDETGDITGKWESDDYYENLIYHLQWKLSMLDRIGNFIKKCTFKSLTPKIAHIFRKLEIMDSHFSLIFKPKRHYLAKAISELSPHITTLDLHTDFSKELGKPDYKFATLLNQFTNLKNLSLNGLDLTNNVRVSGIDFTFEHFYMTMNELDTVLVNLKTEPSIKITIRNKNDEAVATFGTKPNIQIIFHIEDPIFNEQGHIAIENFENYSSQFGHLSNVKYSINVGDNYMYNKYICSSQLKSLVALCEKYGPQLEYLGLTVEFVESEDFIGLVNQSTFMESLVKLSPFVNELSLYQHEKIKLDILNTDADFPKLRRLTICGYQHPLEILKNCPKLKYLKLGVVDHKACLFSKSQQSDEANLAEYFGNLTHLQELYFEDVKKGDRIKIDQGNELDKYLQRLMPNLNIIQYNWLKRFEIRYVSDSD